MFCKNCGKEIVDNVQYCIHCGEELSSLRSSIVRKYFSKKWLIGGLILLTLIVGVSFIVYKTAAPKDSSARDSDIASSVVNIYCEGSTDITGGSGTIITEEGLVLTNAHIIPSDAQTSNSDIQCLVILPDPEDGSPDEIYYAQPLVFPEISEKYDLAFLTIDDVFINDEGVPQGDYPKRFPAYESSRYCKNENVKLGEPVRIYGYPAISGGFALTITDGIVSSLLPAEGLIITSAKISHGNSGGLAVDQYGCRIGIPSMVSSDENESLGVIISNNLIFDFTDEVKAVLNEN